MNWIKLVLIAGIIIAGIYFIFPMLSGMMKEGEGIGGIYGGAGRGGISEGGLVPEPFEIRIKIEQPDSSYVPAKTTGTTYGMIGEAYQTTYPLRQLLTGFVPGTRSTKIDFPTSPETERRVQSLIARGVFEPGTPQRSAGSSTGSAPSSNVPSQKNAQPTVTEISKTFTTPERAKRGLGL